MIIIGEKINGAIPSVKRAIEERDAEFIKQRALMQAEACADFIDVCAGVEADREYDALNWLIGIVQSVTDVPLCLDSPNEKMLEKVFSLAKKPGMLNSVNEEGTKCETIFPLIAKTDWQVIGLTCDQDGIPSDSAKKIDIAKSMIDKAVKYGVDVAKLHIDPCVMALATMPTAMRDFMTCITKIKEYAPEVKITGAISNISFDMPMRKVINQKCMTLAIYAGLDSAS
jgi:5-methyltetrahydrofolate--homocysteine methyltransferase